MVLVRFPHPSGVRGRRLAVVVQADSYSAIVKTLVAAEITMNHALAGDPACLFVEMATPEGQGSGLMGNSVVSCLALTRTVQYNTTIFNRFYATPWKLP